MSRDEIINALGGKESDEFATYDVFASSMGIGLGPYAMDGTVSYSHDEKLHPNNHVAPKGCTK